MNLREKILDVSKELFSKSGYKNVSTKKIAEITGCNEVTIFRIFGKKENILEEILEKHYEKNIFFKEIYESFNGDLTNDLSKFIVLYYNYLIENSSIFKLQLKLSDKGNRKFLGFLEFRNFIIEHFTELFINNKINYSAEEFVDEIVYSMIGEFILEDIQSNKNDIKNIKINKKITFFKNIINLYKQ